ncbi:sigma 54-interacting transcriptional regulator [Desulfosporosinus sp.]|uniref:sigma-54 interaction domain-containing protein n=1 Tax=Desulfosporosinus sp. TaxID=157907 RepID=UPI0025C6049E|nr:sigma 54-interacting transcriptional regulator [Desulfosporosinus sp.]MBC2725936.1 sigma 54-interacting transcriptional regulator [Desulfosporosinus sp.]
MLNLLDFASREFIVCSNEANLGSLMDEFIFGQNKKVIIVFSENVVHRVLTVNGLLHELREGKKDIITSKSISISNLKSGVPFTVVSKDLPIAELNNNCSEVIIIVNDENYPVGFINTQSLLDKILNDYINYTPDMKTTLLEYEKIFENIEEEIFVTDQNGYILRLNPAAEKVCGVFARDVVGKHVRELEKEGIISSSITMHVLHQKKKVNMMQQLKTGKTIISTAIPIFNEEGQIDRVICTSKDYQEIIRLKAELDEKITELARKNQEISLLRQEIFSNVNFIYESKEMKSIRDTISKIAPLDLTVLIQGDSGVGKEVITKAIHNASPRRNQPFIKVNCSMIPENLIESELFGYESGAFTGSTKGGKIGKIELANNGTLFLDEIGEVPLLIQVKLLEFLQDREICKVGGTKRIKINARIITATNRNLQDMVEKGLFRKDLYYRINVIPIYIPPLRERKEEIPVLVEYFLNIFNRKYEMNKKIAPEAMQALYNYNWPGNVRELEHVVERAIVISEADVITHEYLQSLLERKANYYNIICNEIMPLKLAKRKIEEQLVKNAYNIYKSTYKVAKVLEIDQSTVVKLMKRYR